MTPPPPFPPPGISGVDYLPGRASDMLAELFADDADDPEPLVDLSDVKAPGLVDREHCYDPEPGITYGCPTCAEMLDRCAQTDATLASVRRDLAYQAAEADADVGRAEELAKLWQGKHGALLERVATLEGLVRELYITMEHSGCDLRLVARAREMVPDEGPP